MEPEEYKILIRNGNVLDFSTLKETKNQLSIIGLEEIESEISRILMGNRIQKPKLHNNLDSPETDYFLIDLDSEQIEAIVSMFGDLEVGNLGKNYETTRSASYYANLLDKWNELPEYK